MARNTRRVSALIKRDKNYASWRAANAFSKSGRYTTIPPEKEVKRLLKGWGDNYLDNHREEKRSIHWANQE